MARPPRRIPDPPEPRVDAASMARVLSEAVYPRDHDNLARDPMDVSLIADRAGVTVRTIYRYLKPSEKYLRDGWPLDTADRILMAIDRSLDDVELIHA